MKFMNYIIALLFVVLLYACGDPAVEIEEVKYEPKITVEGYLYPGETVNKIKLTRNFPLESEINSSAIILSPEENSVVATLNGIPLSYNSREEYYYNSSMAIEHDKKYKLEVSAVIDGKQLFTESETITPKAGFELEKKNLGTVTYRAQKAIIKFKPSPGTGFYAFSITAVNANVDNFIYDNPYIPNLEREDVEEDLQDYKYDMNLVINVNSESEELISYEVRELDTWFYTNYKVIVYAGDENFKDYLLTVNRVQQPDGNFIEPEFHFKGDGIGVFGSAVKEIVTFNLISN